MPGRVPLVGVSRGGCALGTAGCVASSMPTSCPSSSLEQAFSHKGPVMLRDFSVKQTGVSGFDLLWEKVNSEPNSKSSFNSFEIKNFSTYINLSKSIHFLSDVPPAQFSRRVSLLVHCSLHRKQWYEGMKRKVKWGWAAWIRGKWIASKRYLLWATWKAEDMKIRALWSSNTTTPRLSSKRLTLPEARAPHAVFLTDWEVNVGGAHSPGRSRMLLIRMQGNHSWMGQAHTMQPFPYTSLWVNTHVGTRFYAMRINTQPLSRAVSTLVLYSHIWFNHLLLNFPQSQYQLTLQRKQTAECQLPC